MLFINSSSKDCKMVSAEAEEEESDPLASSWFGGGVRDRKTNSWLKGVNG
ncbi:hypothetical protein Tco_1511016, partial [Tanacetum coccineum]